MIFRRRQDDMEGFRRMREALRQQANPQDHALLDEQYGPYNEDAALSEEDGELEEDELAEVSEIEEYEQYTEQTEGVLPEEAGVASAALIGPAVLSEFDETEAMPRAVAGGPSMTTIGADTSWNGTLRSESNVYLEGKVEGTLEVRDTIYIAERATIDARLKAHSIVVSGQLNGQIDCDGRLEVTPTGRLSGEIEAGILVVHEGAVLDGTFKMKK